MYNQIKHFMPEIVKELNDKTRDCENRLTEIGPGMPDSEIERKQLLNKLCTQFVDSYRDNLNGKFDKRIASLNNNIDEIETSCRIKELFYTLLKEYSSN
mmetsp:Transcript_10606/g.9092  ORF Transcript_10606/g.9092 Transcript_10606/m.9092 type:complete len:99 (+) Transcript_10606:429-725(+)